MVIVSGCLPSPNFTSPTHPARRPWNHRISSCRQWDFRLPATITASVSVDCSESELRARGISLTAIGNSCVVRMALKNRTAAKLLLPSGLITSFKAQMWHGGTMELLHTLVSENSTGPLIQGGLSLALECQNDGFSWTPDDWTLHQVSGTPQESIQVELIGKNEQAAGINAEVKHIISLGRDALTSEVVVHNSSTSSLTLMGSALCHLTVSTPDATYAVGLEHSDFCIRPPVVSDFSIIPPDSRGKNIDRHPGKLAWPFNKLFSEWSVENHAESLEGEEEDNYKHLTEKLSRVYTDAPRILTIIDRGRRNSVTMRRKGFEEVYLFSPGSEHEWYSKYSYICMGHGALLQPIMVNAQSEWRGLMQVCNPNS